MCLRIFAVLLSISGVLSVTGCSGKGTSEPADHLSRAQAKKVFPSVLGSFAQGDFKVQTEDESCALYKSGYLRAQKAVKVVINDCLPKGDPAWADDMGEGDGEIAGLPFSLAKDGGAATLMVRVGPRFRVDFTSRDFGEDTLTELAEAFNWQRLKSLAGL